MPSHVIVPRCPELDSPSVRRASCADIEAILQLVDALAGFESLARPTAEAKKRLAADMCMSSFQDARTRCPKCAACYFRGHRAILQLVDALADYESLASPTVEARKRLAADMGMLSYQDART